MDPKECKGRPLGQVLRKMGKVNRDQVHGALDVQKEKGGVIGQILVDLGYVDQKTIDLALAYQAGMEVVDLDEVDIPEDVIKLIPTQMANAYKIVPISYSEETRTLAIALASADNFRAVDDLRTLMGFNVVAKIADADALGVAMSKYYGTEMESIGELDQRNGRRRSRWWGWRTAARASTWRRFARPPSPTQSSGW